MSRRTRLLIWAHLAWIGVGQFWYVTTRDFHPTAELAAIVTVSLVVASAAAVDLNHFVLIPRFWRSEQYGTYVVALFGCMALLVGAALSVIRISYLRLHGPDADPNGVYKHFAIDLFGVAVHVGVAAVVVWVWKQITKGRFDT